MTTPATLGDIIGVLEAAYPPALAEEWDRVGLVAGDPAAEVSRVLVAVDATDSVVDRALAEGADLLLVHHPPLLRGTHSVAANTPKGRILHKLIAGGCALYSAHTNADSARPGVNDALTRILGLPEGVPLRPTGGGTIDRWVVMIPEEDVGRVLDGVFAAGAGEMGGYSECAFSLTGTGQFRPGDDTDPHLGSVGEREYVTEARSEFVAPTVMRARIRAALHEAHPYEVPAFDILTNHAAPPPDLTSTGLGRICDLQEEMTLAEFTRFVADRLPATAGGVRAAGDPDTVIRRVAVCGGAGGSAMPDARAAGADVYLTGDLRHHDVDEHLRGGGPAVVDAAHWALEFPWCAQAAELLSARFDLRADVCELSTDPWTVSAGAGAPDH